MDKSQPIDISTLTPLDESKFLSAINTDSQSPYGIVLSDVRDDPKYWHMFCITTEDPETEGRLLLRHVINFISPHDLLPVYFIKKGIKAYFLARNCLSAIVQFCRSGLTIDNPKNPNKPYKLDIIANVETTDNIKVIDVQKNLVEVLKRRYVDGEIDLHNFCEDPDLHEFCPLSQQKIMTYIMHLAERFRPTKLNLENNDLRTIDTLEKFADLNITHINLRKNNLQNIGSLKALKKFRCLTHVWLDQNPFIEKLPDSFAYITVAKDMCNKIQYLDGICISSGMPPSNRTFLCSDDATHFTNQFLQCFFPLYDENREKLAELYDPGSCKFSLTYHCSDSNRKLFPMLEEPEHFKFRNRNILKDRSDVFLYKEWPVISNIFNMLPKTKHDPYTFHTDVMQYNKVSAVVTVTGCFKEFSEYTEKWYSFSRTFVLKCIFRRTHVPDASAVWVITNDQLNVMYPSFIKGSNIKENKKKNLRQILENPETDRNYAELEKMFGMLTSLKPEFARAFLEASNYNLKQALESFIDLSKSDSISVSAFREVVEKVEVPVEPPKPRPTPSIVKVPVVPVSTAVFPIQRPSVQKPSPIQLNLQPKHQVAPVPPPTVPVQNPRLRNTNMQQANKGIVPPQPMMNMMGTSHWPAPRQLTSLPRSVTNAQNHPLLKKVTTGKK